MFLNVFMGLSIAWIWCHESSDGSWLWKFRLLLLLSHPNSFTFSYRPLFGAAFSSIIIVPQTFAQSYIEHPYSPVACVQRMDYSLDWSNKTDQPRRNVLGRWSVYWGFPPTEQSVSNMMSSSIPHGWSISNNNTCWNRLCVWHWVHNLRVNIMHSTASILEQFEVTAENNNHWPTSGGGSGTY